MTKYKIEYYAIENGKIITKYSNVIDTIEGYVGWLKLFEDYPSEVRYIRTIKIEVV